MVRDRELEKYKKPDGTIDWGKYAQERLNYTYVLLSKKDNKFYIGWTNDLINRIKQHNTGKVTTTRFRRPLELVYHEACRDEEKAIKREKYFKTGFGRRFLKNRI